MNRRWLIPGLIIGTVVLVQGVSGYVTSLAIRDGYYAELVKPTWTPPPWVFGPVWTALYLMMAVAASLVWMRADARPARLAFVIQLLLNGAWSLLFFGLRSPQAALIDIIFLLMAIVITAVLFWRRRSMAGFLLLPYLVWTAFATALNAAIVSLNS